MKILVAIPMDAAGIQRLRRIPGAEVDLESEIGVPRLREIIGTYQVLIGAESTPLTREVLESAEALQVIGLQGKGRPRLDLELATRRGILVLGAAGSAAVAVAEHALALMLALARKIPRADLTLKKGVWDPKPLLGMQISGKVLGILGLGAVGSEVAQRARGLKMEVIACDPHLSGEEAARRGCRKVTWEELLASSDVISLHAPLSAETRELVNEEAVARMKKGVLVVNCSAPGLVDEGALYEGIVTGRVAGAGLDLEEEAPLQDHPLYLSDRVICTPHLSPYTRGALLEGSAEIARLVADYLERGAVTHAWNLPQGADTPWQGGDPWLQLGEAMGRFLVQLHPQGLRSVIVDAAGEGTFPAIEVLARAALKGILGVALSGTVNLVNAERLAEERGVRVLRRRRSSSSNYLAELRITVNTDRGEGLVSGTLFDGRHPRIVQVNGFELEAIPDGDFLVIFNRDRPGVIADVGEVMGRHGVNIGQMYNGRDARGGKAITLLRIDSPVSDEAMTEIRTLPNVLDATRVHMS